MKITELFLYNFKGFREITKINFSENINIFIGANNSGKSTILQSLLLLQGYSSLNNSSISFRKKQCDIQISFKNPGNSFNIPHINFWNHYLTTIEFSIQNNSLSAHFLPKTAGYKPFGFQEIAQNEPNNLIFPFLSKRKVTNYSEEVSIQALNNVTGNFTFLNGKIDRLNNQEHPFNKIFRQACVDILGFPISSISSSSGKKAVYYLTETEHVSFEQMGEGVPNLLALIVDLCSAEHKVFIIEEPENDIHPKALKALLALMEKKSANNQFFISTHSNIVTKYLGAINTTKTFQITQTIDENRIPSSSIQEISNDEYERVKVLEDLGYDFYDFGLWKGWLFLEEASAESIINRVIIPYFLPKLSGKLRTFSSRGFDSIKTKFDNFNLMETFVYANLEPVYKNRAWVILDSGEKEEQILEKLRNAYVPKGWEKDCFLQFNEHDFEKYYPERFQQMVSGILAIEDGKEKKRRKIEFFKDTVLKWIDEEDSQVVKNEFEISAKEVIEKIKIIADYLK